MIIDRPSSKPQKPSACFACHAIGISSTSALGAYMFYRAKKADTSTHRFTCALIGLDLFVLKTKMSSSASSDSLCTNSHTSLPSSTQSVVKTDSTTKLDLLTNDKQSLLRGLIRYIMRTFYDIPQSLVVEYIYHHECINLNELADRLYLKPDTVRSYIERFKCDEYIIEEHHSNEVFYKIDIATFVNFVKSRLNRMQSATENIERQQMNKPINYKCQQCLREYTARDLEQLSKYSSGGDLICTCDGIVNENDPREEKTVTMRLFNEQMARLFEILEKIDEIMRKEHLIEIHCDTEVNSQKDDVDKYCPNVDIEFITSRDETTAKPLQVPYESKPLPEWFADEKSGDELHHINS